MLDWNLPLPWHEEGGGGSVVLVRRWKNPARLRNLPQHIPRHREGRKTLGESHGVNFEQECYDAHCLNNLAIASTVACSRCRSPCHLWHSGSGASGAGQSAVQEAKKRTADHLFGDSYHWSVLGAGRFQIPLSTHRAMLGGAVRIELDENLETKWVSDSRSAGAGALRHSRFLLLISRRDIIIGRTGAARKKSRIPILGQIGDDLAS